MFVFFLNKELCLDVSDILLSYFVKQIINIIDNLQISSDFQRKVCDMYNEIGI